MATATTAYRNSDDRNNAKNALPSPFTRVAQVRASCLPERLKTLLIHMLSKDRFGDALWLSTESLQVMIGRVCHRRKPGVDTLGRRLGPCDQVSRRSVQKWIDEAAPEDGTGVLIRVIDENSWVGHGKARRFRRSATYELNPAKLIPAKSWDEYHAEKIAAKPVPRRIGPQPSSSPSAQEAASHAEQPPNAAPVPVLPAEHRAAGCFDGSRASDRIRKLRLELAAKIGECMRGCHGNVNTSQGLVFIGEGHPRFRAPMSQDKAITAACMFLGLSDREGKELLKHWQPETAASSDEQPNTSAGRKAVMPEGGGP